MKREGGTCYYERDRTSTDRNEAEVSRSDCHNRRSRILADCLALIRPCLKISEGLGRGRARGMGEIVATFGWARGLRGIQWEVYFNFGVWSCRKVVKACLTHYHVIRVFVVEG